jgi:hypothetical protein
MDDRYFDSIARELGNGFTRRGLVAILVTLAGGASALVSRDMSVARRRKGGKKRKKKKALAAPLCTPACAGKTCGADGCGGSCGSCVGTQHCCNGVCTNQCCDGACPGTLQCCEGLCTNQCCNGSCLEGFTCCAGTCFNLSIDPDHCGFCDRVCADNGCVNGACTCVGGIGTCPCATPACVARKDGPPGACSDTSSGGTGSCETDDDCDLGTVCQTNGVCASACV